MIFFAALPFMNPGFLWAGAAVVTIPIIIHLLNRRRHRKVPWAAMMFLIAANKKTSRRTRIEHWLLMLVRVGIMVLLCLALARPFLQSHASATPLAGGMHHVFVLDDSFSMSATLSPPAGGSPTQTAFQRQIEQARLLLEAIPAADPITVITMGFPARALNRKSTVDRDLAGRLIQAVQPGHTHTDLAGALELVRDRVNAFVEENRSEQAVYLFSDFARTMFGQAAPTPPDELPAESQATPAGDLDSKSSTDIVATQTIKSLAKDITRRAKLVLYDVQADQAGNLANTDLRLVDNIVGPRAAIQIRSTFRNFSARQSAPGRVHLILDGQEMRELTLEALPAGGAQTLSYTIEFDGEGLHEIETRLETSASNALTLDDSRRLVVDVREQVPILIVDGEMGSTPLRGQAGYLAAALSPNRDEVSRSLLATTVISESELAGWNFKEVDTLILCNVRRPGPEVWQRMREHVYRGGGLIVFLGDLVDIDDYNLSAGTLLPSRLIAPAFDEPTDEQFVRFDAGTLSDSLAADFRGRPNSGLFRARIHQYLRLASKLGASMPVLSYTDGQLAITERSVGAGKCLLINTSANMEWTNLPAKGDFITLMMNLVQRAASGNASRRNLVVGDSYVEALPAITSTAPAYTLTRPDGREERLRILSAAAQFELHSETLDRAGWYRLRTPLQEGPLCANLHPSDSDLTGLGQAEIRRLFDCPLDYIEAAEPEARFGTSGRRELGTMMIYAVLLLLLAECLLALLFDHDRT